MRKMNSRDPRNTKVFVFFDEINIYCTKKFLSSLFKVILGQKFINRSEYGKSKLTGLHRDLPQA